MKKKVGIVIDEELWRELKIVAIKKGTSVSRIIESLISEFLERKNSEREESKKVRSKECW